MHNLKNIPDEFILFDTEFTSWKGSVENDWSKIGEYKELVQIGAIKVKKMNNILFVQDRLSLYVKPTVNENLSDYFINLTGITQDTITKCGHPLTDALELFYKFCQDDNGSNIPILSYGNDYGIILINLNKLPFAKNKIKYERWEGYFYDIRNIFRDYVDINLHTSGTIYKAFKIKTDKENVHNALWDCYSMYLALEYLMKTKLV